MTTLIEGGRIVNDGQVFEGSVMIKDDVFASIAEGKDVPCGSYDKRIDATGCFILPGIIDTHVHFREPGLTEKADMESESRAAAWGGVTSFFDMPNTVPQTTTLEALEEKFAIASRHSHVNYSFFYGATNDNAADFLALDVHRIPGIKLFMGSSTGNMLVDKYASLLSVFKTAAQAGLPVMAHCEDTDVINRNMAEMKKVYGDDPDVLMHPFIRSAEACYESSAHQSVLKHFCIAGKDILFAERLEETSVQNDKPAVVEDTDFVFQSFEVEARLSPYTCVDHCQKGGRNVDEVDAPLEGGSGKATQVGHHADHVSSPQT